MHGRGTASRPALQRGVSDRWRRRRPAARSPDGPAPAAPTGTRALLPAEPRSSFSRRRNVAKTGFMSLVWSVLILSIAGEGLVGCVS